MNYSRIIAGPRANYETGASEAIQSFHNGVVTDTELFGKGLDRDFPSRRHPANRKEQLVLLRLKLQGSRGLRAGFQEQADAVAELRQGTVVRLSDIMGHTIQLYR
jgi:hypothetical protein